MSDRNSTGTLGGWMVGTTLVSLGLVCGLVLWQPKPSVLLPSLLIIGFAAAVIMWQQIGQVLRALAPRAPTGEGSEAADARELDFLAAGLSRGDLSVRAAPAGSPFTPALQRLNLALDGLAQITRAAAASAGEIGLAGGEIARASTVMSTGANRQLAGASDIARRLQTLSSRCEEIAHVVEVLDDLARQTNVLALNAALEASRAGTQGRGFAMVAEEVRKLAERSANATRDVGAFIQAIEAGANETARALEEIGSISQTIAGAADETAKVVGELVRSSEELSSTLRRLHPGDSDRTPAPGGS